MNWSDPGDVRLFEEEYLNEGRISPEDLKIVQQHAPNKEISESLKRALYNNVSHIFSVENGKIVHVDPDYEDW